MLKTRFLIIIALLAAILIIPLSVKAFTVKTSNSVYVAKDEIVEGNFFAAGSNITVDGTVTGDVICAGQSININGTVEGDVICAGQSININGTVNGNVRIAGNSMNINGQIARNIMVFGANIYFGNEANVNWDMLVWTATGEIRGKVGRDLYGGAANVVIDGEIGKNIRLKIDRNNSKKGGLIITENAIINGNVTYTDKNKAFIAEGATITGEIAHNLPGVKENKKNIAMVWAWSRLYSIFSALVIGLVLISLWREEILKLTNKMLDKVGVSIGWGAIIMLLTPIIVILLLFTLIGIPLSFILMGAWLIALFISKILVGILIGRSFVEKLWQKQKDSLIWAMILGITITWIIFSIPFIGWLLGLVAIWWGLGGIWLYFKKA